ncbi:MAG TPA: ABC transporter substrate-binding protein [Terriglobales bacterium]|nr:ABC transporter substrate-binding protein [Terriglobales bacterium]
MRTTLRSLAISSLMVFVVTAAARTRPHYGGVVRMERSGGVYTEDLNRDPLVAETLTTVDALGRVQPLLATIWESQNEGRRWQFSVRANVHFHDDNTLTAADIAQALNGKQGAPWKSVRVVGANVVFECEDAQPLLPELLTLQDYAVAKTDASGAVIGTGPFRLVGLVGNTAKLAAFEDYWQGRPYVDAVETTANRNLRDQWMDLSVARTDVVEVPAQQVRYAQQERMRTLVSRNMELIALVPSQQSQALQDSRLRQAISLAIDRNSLLNVIFQKEGEVAAAVLPNWMTGYDFLFPTQQNLVMARDLRGQAKQSGVITIGYLPGDGIQQLVAERVALNARDAGIVMQAVPVRGIVHPDLELLRVQLSSTVPSPALQGVSILVGGQEGDPVDDNLDGIYEAERALLSSYRVIPLLYVPSSYAAGSRVRNWSLTATGSPAVREMWLEDRR